MSVMYNEKTFESRWTAMGATPDPELVLGPIVLCREYFVRPPILGVENSSGLNTE